MTDKKEPVDNCADEHMVTCPYCDYAYKACEYFTQFEKIGDNELEVVCGNCNNHFLLVENVAVVYDALAIVEDEDQFTLN